ncbi:MAG TPA: methionyl-tRNA formyltransferase [Steroidobacteraceae bacterium]|nr:methionyl-tRNA formyltransferase [Steroidobacteraceae bacterium]
MDKSLAVAFAGTPAFALPALDAIAASRHRLVVAYTQPDRPAGRGRRLLASPVKERALALGIPVEQPETLGVASAVARFSAYAPDVFVVVAYGLLLPPALLKLPRFGCLNIHASLLPRWRGAAPVARAIEAGDQKTGVCIMRMEAGLDTGPVMQSRELAIGPGETAGELQERLALVGAELIVAALDALAAGRANFVPQDPALATYARKLGKSEARIDWREPAVAIERRIRAQNPWPVAETRLDGLQLRIWRASVVATAAGSAPGTILETGSAGVVVMTGVGALAIECLQLPGRRPVAAADFARTRPLAGLVLTSV